jgi:hypothetical protein
MSQNDFTLANQSFPAFRADLNSALQALATNNSGATEPSTTFANMWWYDTANNIMYIRNEDNDAFIKFAELDQTNDKFVLSGTLQLDDGTVSAPALTFNSDTNMGIYRGGTDILKFVTAGTDAITIDASQNVDIVGTLQVGVDGTTAGEIRLMDSGSVTEEATISSDANGGLIFGGNSGAGELIFRTGSSTKRMDISSGGDISFYEDTGTTPKLFWDASAEGLGIGTSSVGANALIVEGGTSYFKDHVYIAGGTSKMISSDSSSNPLIFGINTQQKMTLDNSGNLLVGTTNSIPGAGNTAVGASIYNDGRIFLSKSGNTVASFNRNTSDGSIAEFRKDGSTVGSIGSDGSDLYIDSSVSNHAGLRFAGGSILPRYNGSLADNAVDLGQISTNYRFKDLYLSGGVYLGGTGSANKLDDYEEGSYTVGIFDAGSGGNQSPTTTTGYYTKIGDMVFFSFNITGIDITGLTSGNNASFSLPFTSSSTQNKNFCALVHVLASDVNWAGSQTQLSSFVGTSTSRFQFWVSGDNIAVATVKVSEISSADFYVSGQFRV